MLMRQGKIDKVIVGADRIAANGDAANKTALMRWPFWRGRTGFLFTSPLRCPRLIFL
jgi:hypothetical protein